jgi:hypothetical protein
MTPASPQIVIVGDKSIAKELESAIAQPVER